MCPVGPPRAETGLHLGTIRDATTRAGSGRFCVGSRIDELPQGGVIDSFRECIPDAGAGARYLAGQLVGVPVFAHDSTLEVGCTHPVEQTVADALSGISGLDRDYVYRIRDDRAVGNFEDVAGGVSHQLQCVVGADGDVHGHLGLRVRVPTDLWCAEGGVPVQRQVELAEVAARAGLTRRDVQLGGRLGEETRLRSVCPGRTDRERKDIGALIEIHSCLGESSDID